MLTVAQTRFVLCCMEAEKIFKGWKSPVNLASHLQFAEVSKWVLVPNVLGGSGFARLFAHLHFQMTRVRQPAYPKHLIPYTKTSHDVAETA